jgi:hypothetical protein
MIRGRSGFLLRTGEKKPLGVVNSQFEKRFHILPVLYPSE